MTMAKEIKSKNKNKNKNNKVDKSNNILKNIDSDDNSSSKDNNKENNEPSFYEEANNEDQEEEKEKENENEHSENHEKLKKKEEEMKKKYEEKNKKKIEKLKEKGIEIDNIYDINKEFNYDMDKPVFYLKENRAKLNKYPEPLSTKQVADIVKRNNIPYENLKVKLVDLFEFKLRNAFEYVDFMVVIKPEWASNVTYSKIFMDLYNSKIKKEQAEKDNDKKEDKKEDKKDLNDISQSEINKDSQMNTFSAEEKFVNNMDGKEEEKGQSNNNNKNFYPRRNNKKKKKGKGNFVDLKY